MNFGIYLERSARYWPEKPAILFRDGALTYRQLEERSNRLAHSLVSLGLKKGDRIAIISANRPEIVEAECAFYKLGIVKVALNSRLSATELEDALINADPMAVIVSPSHFSVLGEIAKKIPNCRIYIAWDSAENSAEAWLDYEALLRQSSAEHIHVPLKESDLAVLHYTSGSTGKLKAAMQTMGNRMTSLRKVIMGRMHTKPDDIMLLCGPITHASGMFIQAMLYQGATILLLERFHPSELLEAIERYKVTMCFMVPAMIHALLAEPSIKTRNLSSLRLVSYGAAPMSPSRIKEAWDAFGPVLAQGYRAGETTGGIVSLSIDDHLRAIEGGRSELLSSCGRVQSESEVKILDDDGKELGIGDIGEICVRGPDVFAGYWRAEESTKEVMAADGWLKTGDLAKVDKDGYIYIVDRRKAMIVSGGFNIYPSEIEAILSQHPSVYEVCVVGVPDDHWGESVKAVIVLREGYQVGAQELIDFVRPHLADFKKPRTIDFVKSLPKNSNGKISRKDIREVYWQGRERKVN